MYLKKAWEAGKGSCYPYYDGEKNRRPIYHQLLQENKLLNGLAIDDHVALHYMKIN